MNRDFRHCLVGSIKGLASESKLIRHRLHSSKSDERKNSFAESRKFLGLHTRHHLLAYAYLKGIPYFKIESKCREDNKPDAKLICNILAMYLYYPLDPETVKKWLEKGE